MTMQRQCGQPIERRRRCNTWCHILERDLVHVAAFHVSLVMRTRPGVGTPRELVVAIWVRIGLGYRAAVQVAIRVWPDPNRRPVFAADSSSPSCA